MSRDGSGAVGFQEAQVHCLALEDSVAVPQFPSSTMLAESLESTGSTQVAHECRLSQYGYESAGTLYLAGSSGPRLRCQMSEGNKPQKQDQIRSDSGQTEAVDREQFGVVLP
jgi:hypothetical protein